MQAIFKAIATVVLLVPVGARAETTHLGNDPAYENAGSLTQVSVRCNEPLTREFVDSIRDLADAAIAINNQFLLDSFGGGIASANRIIDANGCDSIINYIETQIYPGEKIFLNR